MSMATPWRGWVKAAGVALLMAAAGAAVLVATSRSSAEATGNAKVTVHQSSVGYLSSDQTSVPGTDLAYGRVQSNTQHCVKGRRVLIYFLQPGGKAAQAPGDIGRSGQNGYFIGADTSAVGVTKLVLQRSEYGPKKHRQVCSGDVELPTKR
jgi:hypothetical protein